MREARKRTMPDRPKISPDAIIEFLGTRENKRQGKVRLKPSGVVLAGVPYGRPDQAPFAVR